MSLAEVVQLRDRPPIGDIVGSLRRLADEIEHGDIETRSVIVIVPAYEPAVLVYGNFESDFWLAGMIDVARSLIVKDIIETGEANRG